MKNTNVLKSKKKRKNHLSRVMQNYIGCEDAQLNYMIVIDSENLEIMQETRSLNGCAFGPGIRCDRRDSAVKISDRVQEQLQSQFSLNTVRACIR